MLLLCGSLLALLCVTLLAMRYGAEVAIYGSIVLLSLAPTWVGFWLGEGRVDIRMTCLGLAFLLRASLWPRVPFGRFCFADLLVASLAISTICSKMQMYDLGPTMIYTTITMWILPYLLGRIIASLPHARTGMVVAASVTAAILSCLVVFEAVVGVNPINAILSHASTGNTGGVRRWGLLRAEAVAWHPIAMGMILAALLPWVLTAVRQIRSGAIARMIKPWHGIGLLLLTFAGVFCTMSRGPLLVVLGTMFLVVIIRMQRYRTPIACALVIGLVAVGYNALAVTELLEKVAQEDKDGRQYMVKGKVYQYTGTSHRIMLFPIYEDAMAAAGWLGFGRFDMKNPDHSQYIEPHLREPFTSIDNHYIFTLLADGYLGLGIQGLILIVGVYYSIRLADRDRDFLSAALAAWLCSMILMNLTVCNDNDFRFYILLNLGLISGFYARRPDSRPSFNYVETRASGRAHSMRDGGNRRQPQPARNFASDFQPQTSRTMRSTSSHELMPHNGWQAPAAAPYATPMPSAVPTTPGIDGRIIRKYLLLSIVAGICGASAAYFFGPKLETTQWIHQARLNFRSGRLNVDSYHQPDLSAIMPDAFSKPVLSEALGHHLGPSVRSALEVRYGMGTPFIDLKMMWPDEAEGKQLLQKAIDAGIQYSVQYRADRLEESKREIENELSEVARQVALVENEQLQFQLAHGVTNVATELAIIQQEIRGLEVQLLDARAHRKGIDAKLVQQEVQGEQSELLGATPKDYVANLSKQRELQRELALLQADRTRTKARLQYENQLKEVERKRALHAKQLLTDAELERAELGLKLFAVDMVDNGSDQDVASKLGEVEEKLALRQTLNDNLFNEMVGDEISSRERITSLEDRLNKNRLEEPRLRDLLPKEQAILAKRTALDTRHEELQRQASLCVSFARSNINELYVEQGITPAEPATKTDLIKISLGLFAGCFGLVLTPFAFADALKAKRKRDLQEMTNIGLGQLGQLGYINRHQPLLLEDHAGEVNAPPAEVRRMINQLFAVMPPNEYVLLFASLQNEPPSMALMFDVARCFSRRGRNVVLVIVDPAVVDIATGETKPRFRDTQYASQLPDRFEIEHVDSAQEVVTDLDRHRRNFDLVIVAAGFDASDSQDLDVLSFYADGVVFTDIGAGTGKHFEKRVSVVRQLNETEGNVLGLIS